MKQNKKLLLALGAVVALMALFAGVYAFTRPDAAAGDKTIVVEVVHKDTSAKTFIYETDEEFLGAVLLEEGLVKGDAGQYGLYITEVDGEVADYNVDKGYWALYEEEEFATQGADTTPIQDGDRFRLVYTVG